MCKGGKNMNIVDIVHDEFLNSSAQKNKIKYDKTIKLEEQFRNSLSFKQDRFYKQLDNEFGKMKVEEGRQLIAFVLKFLKAILCK